MSSNKNKAAKTLAGLATVAALTGSVLASGLYVKTHKNNDILGDSKLTYTKNKNVFVKDLNVNSDDLELTLSANISNKEKNKYKFNKTIVGWNDYEGKIIVKIEAIKVFEVKSTKYFEISGFKKLDLTDFIKFNYDKKFKSKDKCQLYLDSLNKNDPNVYGKIKNDQIFILKEKPNKLDFVYLSAEVKGLNSDIFDVHFNYKFSGEIHDDKLVNNEAEIHIEKDITKTYSFTIDNTKENEEAKARQDLRDILNHYNELKTKVDSDKLKYNTFDSKYDELINSINEDIKRINELLIGSEPVKDKVVNETNVYQDRNNALNALNLKNLIASAKKYESKIDNLNDSKYKKDINGNVISKALDDEIASDENILKNQETSKYLDAINNLSNKFNEYKATLNNVLNEAKKLFKDNKATYQPVIERLKSYKTTHNTLTPAEQKVLDNFAKCEEIDANNDIFDINSTPTAAINSYNELVKSIANLTTEQAANKKNAEDKIKDQLTHFNELNQEITNLHGKLQSHISIDLEYKTLVNDFYTKSIDNNEKSILKNWLDEMDVYLGDKDSNKYLNALKNLEEIKTFVADYIVKLNTTKTKLDDATSSELIALANQLEIELKDKEATIDLKTTQASNYLNSSMSASNDFENYRNSQSALLAKNERKFAENKTLIIEFLNAENNSYTNKYLSEITNALALADKKLSDFHAIDPHSLYENNKTLEKELNFAGAYLDLLQNAKNDNKLENLFAPILASVLNQLKQNIAKFDSDVEQIKNDYAKELAKAKENANNKLKEINDLKDRYINQEQLDKFATGGEALSIVKDAIANNPMPNPNSATIDDYNNFINKIDKALNDSKRQYDQSLAEAKNRLEELKNNLNNKKSSLVPPEAYPLSVVEIDKLIDKIDKNLKANPAKNLGELLIAEKEINEVDLNAIIEQDKVNLINNCKTIYNELIAQRENYNNHTAGTIGDAKYASDIQFKIEEVIKFVDAQGNNNETIIKTHIDLNPSYKDVNVNDIYIEYQLLANDKKHFEDSLKEYDVKWNKAKENLENKINEVQGSINSLVDPYKGRVSSLLTTIGTDLDKYNLTTLQDYYNQLQSKYEEAVQKSGAKAENLKIFNDKVKELNNKITECNDNDAPDYANTLVANETVKNLLEKAKQAATSASATATDIQNQSNEIDKLIKAIKDQYDKNLAIAIANLQQANSDLLVSRTKLTTDYATRINGAISANDLTNSDINNHSSLYYETYTLVGDNSNKHNPTTAISVKNLNNKIVDVNSEKNKLDSIYQTQVDVDKKYQQLFNDLQTKTNTLETKINTNNLNTINQISLALNELKTILSNILSIGNITKSSGENELKDKYDDTLKKYNLLVQTCDEQITNDKNILGDLIQKLNAKNNFVTTNNSTLKDIKNANGLKGFDSNFATFKNDYNNSTNHAKLQEDITKAKNYLTAFETEISKVEKSLLNNLKQALNDYQSFVDDTTQTKINNPKLSDVKDAILKNLNDKLEEILVPAKSVKTENDVDTNGPDVIESYINKINAALVEANNEVQNDLALIPPKISQLNVARNTLSDLVKYIEENNNSNTSADLTAAKELLTNTEENALINKNLSQINEYLDQSSKLIDALNKEKEALINNAKNGLAKAIDVATKIIIDLGNSADNGYKDLCDNLKDALNRAKAVYDNNTLTPNDYKNARSDLDSMCSYTTDNAGQLRKEQNNKIGELLNNLKASNSAKTVITAIADESKKYGDLNNDHSNDTEYKNSAAIIAEGENKKDFKDYVIGTAPDTPKDLSVIVKKLEELQAYFNSLKSFYDDSWNKAKSNYLTSLSTIKKDLETIKNSSTENDDKYNVIEQKVNSITVNDESSLKAYEEANKTLVSASTDLQNYKNELNDTYTSINKIYENIKKLIVTLTAEDTLASDLLKALNDELNSENINDTSVNENATQNKLEKLVIAKTFEAKLQNILDKHIKTYWNKIDSKLQSLQDSLESNNVSNLGAKTIIDELNNTTKYAGIYTDELNELTARVNSENDKELKLKKSLKQNQNINLLSGGISLKSLEAEENDVNTLNQSANDLKIKIEGTWNEAYASANAALQKLKDSKEKWSKGILYEPALGTDAQENIDKYTSNPNDVTNNNQTKQFYDDKKDEIESTIVELLKSEKTQRVDYKTKVYNYYEKLAFLRNKYKNLGNKFINVENHYKNNFPISSTSGNTKGIFELLTEAMTAGEVKQIEDSLKSFETSLKAEVKTSLESVQDELRTQYEAYKNARQTNNTELDLYNKNLYADQGDLALILKGILDEDSKIEKLITLQTSDPDQIKNVIDTLNQLKDNLSSWNNNHQKFAKNLSDKREEIKSQINIADSFISANQGKAYANELNTYLNTYKAEFNNNKWNLQLATDKLSELKSKIKIAQDAKDNENQTIDNIKKTIKKSLDDYQILINKEAVDQTLLIGKTFEVDQNQLDNYKAKNPTTVAKQML